MKDLERNFYNLRLGCHESIAGIYKSLSKYYEARANEKDEELKLAREEIAELESLLQGAISEAEFKEYKRRTKRAEK